MIVNHKSILFMRYFCVLGVLVEFLFSLYALLHDTDSRIAIFLAFHISFMIFVYKCAVLRSTYIKKGCFILILSLCLMILSAARGYYSEYLLKVYSGSIPYSELSDLDAMILLKGGILPFFEFEFGMLISWIGIWGGVIWLWKFLSLCFLLFDNFRIRKTRSA